MAFQPDTPSLADHSWSIFAAGEAVNTQSDRAWHRYVDRCEKRLGVATLDGDERTDGYSIDSALEAFEAGISAERYAAGERLASPWRSACG